jgi:hypothetical protein
MNNQSMIRNGDVALFNWLKCVINGVMGLQVALVKSKFGLGKSPNCSSRLP